MPEQESYPGVLSAVPGNGNRPANLAIAVAIVLLVGIALIQTYHSSKSATVQENSDLSSELDSATRSSKTAFAHEYYSTPPGVKPPKESAYESELRHVSENTAIDDWKLLATPEHRISTRKLGITLFAFHRTGGMTVLSGIGIAVQRPIHRHVAAANRRLRLSRTETSQLPYGEEQAVWSALYGVGPLDVHTVPALRHTITSMNLGWFENLALQQLYTRAGMPVQAGAAHARAYRTATELATVSVIDLVLLLSGIILWIALGVWAFIKWTEAPMAGSDAVPAPANETYEFSYRARTTAFAVFLSLYLSVRYPLRYILPDTSTWSDAAALRLTAGLVVIIYIPVVLCALYVMRRIAARENGSGKLPSLRLTLTSLGLNLKRPLADAGYGLRCYVLTWPLFIGAGVVSAMIFHAAHSPVNPVLFETSVANTQLDQLIMLAETAIAAPFVEELMFRGVLFSAFRSQWGVAAGAMLSAAVFALLHPDLPIGFLPLWTLGTAFAVAYQRRQSLISSIVMHGLHNGLITISMFLLYAK